MHELEGRLDEGGERRIRSQEGKRKDESGETAQWRQVGEIREGEIIGKKEARHSVCGVLLKENKSLLLFYHSYMTAGIVKHT